MEGVRFDGEAEGLGDHADFAEEKAHLLGFLPVLMDEAALEVVV